jgi:hypothetical protein
MVLPAEDCRLRRRPTARPGLKRGTSSFARLGTAKWFPGIRKRPRAGPGVELDDPSAGRIAAQEINVVVRQALSLGHVEGTAGENQAARSLAAMGRSSAGE